jgi:hypothetical protein
VNRNTWSHADPAPYKRAHDAILPRDQSEYGAPPTPGAALMIVVLSSLGLWCVIWLAVSSLTSALPY